MSPVSGEPSGLDDPVSELGDQGVHTRALGAATPHTKRNHANLHPVAILLTHERTSRVPLKQQEDTVSGHNSHTLYMDTTNCGWHCVQLALYCTIHKYPNFTIQCCLGGSIPYFAALGQYTILKFSWCSSFTDM